MKGNTFVILKELRYHRYGKVGTENSTYPSETVKGMSFFLEKSGGENDCIEKKRKRRVEHMFS